MWKVGDRLRHRFNPELGPGLVEAVTGRTVLVRFPDSETSLQLAASSDALEPLRLEPGARVLVAGTDEPVLIAEIPEAGRVRLADGRVLSDDELWPAPGEESLVDRMARGDVDALDRFATRLDALHLLAIREADGLGSFLGGRIRLFPHQLHAAERATRTDPVRWLLADEVGLGKTVEACLILNHLLHTGRAERALIVAPDTLTVQWLGELWRKYHQVFVLLDEDRLVDVEKDYGHGFNVFEAHRRVVVGIDFLVDRPWLTERAVEAGIDVLIVDEAHHLSRPRGHPGNPAYRAIRPIADTGRHLLLLTATPLEEDAFGFFRLLQLLRPEEFPEETTIEARLDSREPLPPCTSATRRVDVGGLPPRAPAPVELDAEAWKPLEDLERALRLEPAEGPIAERRKLRRIRRALCAGPAFEALLDSQEVLQRQRAREAAKSDPRLAWLVERAEPWRAAGDKTLVFVAHRESLEWLRTQLRRRAQLATGVFHEDLSAGQRDIEVAQFRLPSGPSLLVSTECGGEGRNFEFCTRIVLFDLPWQPMTVEQRIGRLDRIGRDRPVEIVYFRPPTGVGSLVARVYELLGLFESPLGGIERELAPLTPAFERAALSAEEMPTPEAFAAEIEDARRAQERIRDSADHELHREPYRPELAERILARVPDGLDELTQDAVLGVAERLHLHVEDHRDGRRHSIELGTSARVASLPGVPQGASFLGSFDRGEALADEGIDFFASGHPLVEGVLAHLEESRDGRTVFLHVRGPEGVSGFGLLAFYRAGPDFEAIAVDIEGRERPDWARWLTRRPLRSRRVRTESWTGQPGWADLVRRMATALGDRGRPVALAAFRLDGAASDDQKSSAPATPR